MEEKGEGGVKKSQQMGDVIYRRRPQTKKNEMSKNPLSYLLNMYR